MLIQTEGKLRFQLLHEPPLTSLVVSNVYITGHSVTPDTARVSEWWTLGFPGMGELKSPFASLRSLLLGIVYLSLVLSPPSPIHGPQPMSPSFCSPSSIHPFTLLYTL